MLKSLFVGCLLIGVTALFYVAVAANLDQPIPVYNERGQITAFDTPSGRVEKGNPMFDELIKSYR